MDKVLDTQSVEFLGQISESDRRRGARVPGVRTVLVVLSSREMVYDVESLRFRILSNYPEATIFFMNTNGSALGQVAPYHIDLLIDFTGPGERQSFLFPKKLRRMARTTVGRRAGFLRKRLYDRLFDERAVTKQFPKKGVELEQIIQRSILEIAGVSFTQQGAMLPDKSKTIALDLPLLLQTK